MENQITLTPYALDHPVVVAEDEYQQLVRRTEQGWSACQTETEFFAKLHYLREGFKAGKLDEANFLEREKKLALSWWKKFR